MRKTYVIVGVMLAIVLTVCVVVATTGSAEGGTEDAVPAPVELAPSPTEGVDLSHVWRWLEGKQLAETKAYLEAVQAHRLEEEREARAARAAAAAASRKSSIVTATAVVYEGEFPAILIRIRGCESGHNYKAENPYSTASGAYQFLDSTWKSTTGTPGPASAYSPAEQDAAALKLYRSSGTTPWNASKYCWG